MPQCLGRSILHCRRNNCIISLSPPIIPMLEEEILNTGCVFHLMLKSHILGIFSQLCPLPPSNKMFAKFLHHSKAFSQNVMLSSSQPHRKEGIYSASKCILISSIQVKRSPKKSSQKEFLKPKGKNRRTSKISLLGGGEAEEGKRIQLAI